MQDSTKYLIHADFTAKGVVERNDVVGAVFGQTEGLLGDELDLRELQEGSKVGRVDVDVTSEGGQSFGDITIASGLDRVETAILAASLETIGRVGPCRASVTVTDLEDVRSAKRRTVVERATELLADFEADAVTSHDIVEEVRQRLRVEDITEYEGCPAGPRVPDSDATIVVEGRADVLQLLQYGIKNAIAVEGTDIPDAVAELSRERTVTAFLDGDRGGELILKELVQVGAVDYVAFAPAGTSVEDLARSQILAALRDKVPYDAVEDGEPAVLTGENEADEMPAVTSAEATSAADRDQSGQTERDHSGQADRVESTAESEPTATDGTGTADETTVSASAQQSAHVTATTADTDDDLATLAAHSQAVIGDETEMVRFLDADVSALSEGPVGEAFERIENSDPVPTTVVMDGTLTQRILDVAAQRGVEQVVPAETGEFVKQPTSVRIRQFEKL
ncbi:DNA primase [Halobacteriales archaeon QS_4_62_28]|nr:MAG: DNA primase [Halobacteriales archaeon QS_4_62_28]